MQKSGPPFFQRTFCFFNGSRKCITSRTESLFFRSHAFFVFPTGLQRQKIRQNPAESGPIAPKIGPCFSGRPRSPHAAFQGGWAKDLVIARGGDKGLCFPSGLGRVGRLAGLRSGQIGSFGRLGWAGQPVGSVGRVGRPVGSGRSAGRSADLVECKIEAMVTVMVGDGDAAGDDDGDSDGDGGSDRDGSGGNVPSPPLPDLSFRPQNQIF